MMDEQRIETPCPACGSQALFIGKGGHLTCGRLSCPEPGVEAEVVRLKAALSHAVVTLVAVSAMPHPRGAPYLWADSPTLAATITHLRATLRLTAPADPLPGPR